MKKLLLAITLLMAPAILAQNTTVTGGGSNTVAPIPPAGTCSQGDTYTNSSNNNFYYCDNGVWTLITANSTGTNWQGTPIPNAIVTDFDPTHVQTPSANATVDSSGNIDGTSFSTSGGVTPAGTGTIAFGEQTNASGWTPQAGASIIGSLTASPWWNCSFNNAAFAAQCFPFQLIMSGTNTAAAMVVGSGATLSATGTGTIAATSVPGFSTGANGGTGGSLTLNGATSGSASIAAAAVAGTPSTWYMPTTDGTNNQCLTTGTPSGGFAQLAWANCSSASFSFPITVSGTVTSGGIPYFNSTTQMSSSAILGANQVVRGGGAGSAPTSDSTLTFSSNNLGITASGTNAFQTVSGSTSGTFTMAPNAAAMTKVVFAGTNFGGMSLPVGSATNTSVDFGTTGTGIYSTATATNVSIAIGTSQSYSFGASLFGLSGSMKIQNLTATAALTIQAGQDTTSSSSTFGQLLIKGASITSGAASGAIAGNIFMQGGDNSQTGATESGGDVVLRAGQVTSATPTTANNGRLLLEAVGVKGATYTVGKLQCVTASSTTAGYPPTYGDCTTAGANEAWVGVATTANTNSATLIESGIAGINSNASTTFTAGHFACLDGTNAGLVVDSSTACTAGQGVGIVTFTDGSSTTGPHYVKLARF